MTTNEIRIFVAGAIFLVAAVGILKYDQVYRRVDFRTRVEEINLRGQRSWGKQFRRLNWKTCEYEDRLQ